MVICSLRAMLASLNHPEGRSVRRTGYSSSPVASHVRRRAVRPGRACWGAYKTVKWGLCNMQAPAAAPRRARARARRAAWRARWSSHRRPPRRRPASATRAPARRRPPLPRPHRLPPPRPRPPARGRCASLARGWVPTVASTRLTPLCTAACRGCRHASCHACHGVHVTPVYRRCPCTVAAVAAMQGQAEPTASRGYNLATRCCALRQVAPLEVDVDADAQGPPPAQPQANGGAQVAVEHARPPLAPGGHSGAGRRGGVSALAAAVGGALGRQEAPRDASSDPAADIARCAPLRRRGESHD